MPSPIDRRLADIAALQHGVFTAKQAHLVGLSDDALTSRAGRGHWTARAKGLFTITGSPATWRQELWLGILEAPPGSPVSNDAACQLHGLPLRSDLRGRVDILTAHDLDHRARFSILHQTRDLPEHHITTVDGIPVTTLARTLFDQAAHVRPKWLAALTDAAMHQCGMPIGDLVDVTLRLAKRGRKGGPAMRRIVAERVGDYTPTESVLENEFVDLCSRYGLPEPLRQVVLGDHDVIGRVDFFFPPALVIEVDGRAFHAGRTAEDRDGKRDGRLHAQGFVVRRLGWAEIVGAPAATATKLKRLVAAMSSNWGRVPARTA